MFSAAELIQAVQRKLRLTQRRAQPPGEFPPDWKAWFASMQAHPGEVKGAPASAIVAALLERPPIARVAVPIANMTRWQAFSSVWRQQWQPVEPQERGLRWFSAGLSGVLHVILAAMLLWLLFAAPRFESASPEGDTVVQVEYIGVGTPDEVGGGPAPEAEQAQPTPAPAQRQREAVRSPTTEAVPAPPQATVDVAVDTPSLPLATPPVEERQVPTPEPPAPAVEQPLTVSEPAPDDTEAFFLPPPTPRMVEPTVAAPELTVTRPTVETRDIPEPVEAPALPALDMPQPQPVATPDVAQGTPEVAVREVPTPLRRAAVPQLPQASINAPELTAPTSQVREMSIPAPAAATPSTATAATPSSSSQSRSSQSPAESADASDAASASTASATPSSSAAASPSTAPSTSPGSGPRPTPAPGGWPTPDKADDWGAADRMTPGAQSGEGPGLYNSDGSVRLAETPGSASPGQPPGAYSEEITDLDRNGTWLKRPAIGYEPTLFDRYWRPNETLLEEWVRRGIKTVSIPIPGTTKKIDCAVSLLALGGGCGISDPNLNEQPAEARPPPDIPFKPELQGDNGSVKPGGG